MSELYETKTTTTTTTTTSSTTTTTNLMFLFLIFIDDDLTFAAPHLQIDHPVQVVMRWHALKLSALIFIPVKL